MRKAISFIIILCMLTSIALATDHIVISELGVDPSYDGDTSDTGKEYIELYNPTDSSIDISNWYLKFKGRSSSWNIIIPTTTSIASHGFYLIGDTGGKGWPATWPNPDLQQNMALTNNDYGAILFNNADEKIDAVGWGNLIIYQEYFETEALNNPINGYFERKPGYVMPDCGNWQDNDNNSDDFLDLTNADPQNSASTTETPCGEDTTPPGPITNMHLVSKTQTTITWAWDNPSDNDFDVAIVSLNGENYINTSDATVQFTGLSPNTQYTVSIKTKDRVGNVNVNEVTDTQTTESQGCITNAECDNDQYCDGEEICDNGQCIAGTPITCDDSVSCTEDTCNEDTDSCDFIPNDSLCDDGAYCNGAETCHITDDCQAAADIDCSPNNIDPISECTYSPDDNPWTLDTYPGFESVCNEDNDECTTEEITLTYECNLDCGAECISNDQCGTGQECDTLTCECFSVGDDDEDGVENSEDNCPTIPNADQLDSDSDDIGNVCDICPNDADNDIDQDTICGDIDNCPNDANTDQANSDGDEEGDVCDFDSDNDGVDDEDDNCPTTPNADQTNSDTDSLGDACDNCINNDNEDQADIDDDELGDACDPDSDNDGINDIADYCILDPLNDIDEDEYCANEDNCPVDYNEDQADSDEDNIGDVCDAYPNDYDNDGIDDDIDTITGNNSDITTNLDCINLTINNESNLNEFNGLANVIIDDCNNNTITEFEFNFNETNTLDLRNINISIYNSGSNITIKGLNLNNFRKTAYIKNILKTDTLCIKDEEIDNFEVVKDCTNGIKIICPEIKEGYNCTKIENNTIFKISGLKHSAVVQYKYEKDDDNDNDNNQGNNNRGGSSGAPSRCSENWKCTPWSVCTSSRIQTRTCNDNNNCKTNLTKPSEKRSCTYFPPEEDEVKVPSIKIDDKKPTTQQNETQETTAETKPGLLSITGAFIGNLISTKAGLASLIALLIIILIIIIILIALSKRPKNKKRKKKSKKGMLFLGLFLLLALATFANADNIVISEVLYNPIGPENKEWVELYNPTDQEIDISNWNIYSFSTESPDITIPDNTQIDPWSFYLITEFDQHTPDHTEQLWMTNRNSGIQLRNSSDDIIDSVGWGSSPLFYETNPLVTVTEGSSIERAIGFDCIAIDTNNNIDDFNELTTPNPKNSAEACEPSICNDGTKNGLEVCDTFDVGIMTCQDFGFSQESTLSCNVDCLGYNISTCESTCGDGNPEPGEECDDHNLEDGDGCSSECINELVDCGNNEIDGIEVCDEENFNGLTCQDYGYSTEEGLVCNGCLSIDSNGCTPTCGDGNPEPGEECDDHNLEDGDGCSSSCQIEVDDDLQVNYIRGLITIDGVPAEVGTPFKVEITNGENEDWIYDGTIDNNIPSFLQGNGYFDTLDRLMLSTDEEFEITSQSCNGNIGGVLMNGGNGDFLSANSLIQLDCTIDPVINKVNHTPLQPNNTDEIIIYANITDNLAIDSVQIGYVVNNITQGIYDMTLDNGLYTFNLGTFNENDFIQYIVHANDTYGNEVTSDLFNITIMPEMIIIDFSLNINPGWNLISVPIVPSDSNAQVLFNCISTIVEKPPLAWESPLFVAAAEIEPKVGYWLFSTEAKTCEINGTIIDNTTIILNPGWNLIGTTGTSNIDISSIPNQVAERPALYWNNPLFEETNVIEPGKAAWVFVTEETEI